jgi:hypothetical protein
MKSAAPINVMFAASASAFVAGGFAVVFVPALAFFYLVSGNRPMEVGSEYGMMLAVVAPLCCTVAGFILGALMASLANMLAEPSFRPLVVKEERLETYPGAATDAA